jgi:hypothetical protein
MKILLDVPFLDYRGQPIKDEIDPAFTLRSVLLRSALYVPAGTNPPGEAKFKAYELAMKIHAVPQGRAANFSTEELATLKVNSGAMWLPWVVGLTWSFLDAHFDDADAPPK